MATKVPLGVAGKLDFMINDPDTLAEMEGGLDSALTTATDLGSNAVAHAYNFGSNLGEMIGAVANHERSQLGLNVDSILGSNMSTGEKLLSVVKAPFSVNKRDSISQSLTDYASEKSAETKKQEALRERTGEYATGALPSMATELLMYGIPTARFGAMKRTKDIIGKGATTLDKAKAVAMDATENAVTFAGVDTALAKLYGKSDEEAIADGVASAIIGGFGTPVVAGGMKALRKTAKTIEEGEELMAQQAGGGKPPEMVDPRVDTEEVIQTGDVGEIKNPVHRETKEDFRGRVYDKDKNTVSPQGRTDEKATFKFTDSSKIENLNDEINLRIKAYENEQARVERYGSGDTSFKGEVAISPDKKVSNRKKFIEFELKDIMKDKAVKREIREEAKSKLKQLRDTGDIGLQKVEVDETKARKEFDSQFTYKTPTNYHKQSAELKTQFANREKRDTTNVDTTQAVKSVTSKLEANKEAVRDAIYDVTKKERLKGKDFDWTRDLETIKQQYPNQYKLINDHASRIEDVKAHRSGKMNFDEFQFREETRIKSNIEDVKTGTHEDAEAIIQGYEKEFADIGITANANVQAVKQKNFSAQGKNKPKDTSKEVKAQDKKREIMARAIDAYKNRRYIYRSKSGDNAGKPFLSESIMKEIEQDVLKPEEILDKYYPKGDKATVAEALKTNKVKYNTRAYARMAKKLGIKGKFKQSEKIKFKNTVEDASNSAFQMLSVLLSDKTLAQASKLTADGVDGRLKLADRMTEKLGADLVSKITKGKKALEKDHVKKSVMIGNYGSSREGLVKQAMNDFKITKEEADRFIKAYDDVIEEEFPQLAKFQSVVEDVMKTKKKADFEWKMPDGFTVKFSLQKSEKYTMKIKGMEKDVEVKTDDLNSMARALFPHIVHSVDGYVARQMNKRGYPSNHDAFFNPVGRPSSQMMIDYLDILADVNDKDILGNILKDIGYKGDFKKSGTLTRDDLVKGNKGLSPEHHADEIVPDEELGTRAKDLARNLQPEDVMRDFMASGNYRTTPTNKLLERMVYEASHNSKMITDIRKNQDPFERQMALAFRSAEYDSAKAVPTPENVNPKMWDKVQREIFNEARAKVEYDPVLKDIVKGDRKYFDEWGNMLGKSRMNSMASIMRKEYLKKLREDNPKKAKVYLRANRNRVTLKGKKIDNLKTEELKTASDLNALDKEIKATTLPDKENTGFLTRMKRLFEIQTKSSKVYDEANKLHHRRKTYDAEVQRREEDVVNRLSKLTKEQEIEMMPFVKGNYEIIRGMTQKDARKFFDENRAIYAIANKEIEQMAKGLQDRSQMYGYYLDNGLLVAKRYDLPDETGDIIDRLVAIRAMDNSPKAWDRVENLNKDADFNYIMDIMATNRMHSEEVLFGDSPEKMIKGWTAEVYEGHKKVGDDGEIRYSGDTMFEDGIIGREGENKKIGNIYDGDIPEFSSLQDKLEWLHKNRLKDNDGVFRTMLDSETRDKLGRQHSLAKIVGATQASVHAKLKDRAVVDNVLHSMESGETQVFSKEAKYGFVELTSEEIERLPFELRGQVKHIHKDVKEMMVGREEVRLYKGDNESLKVADRLFANLGSMFKKNVTLKRPTSYINAALVNQTIGASVGISPKKLYAYQKQALADAKELKDLIQKENEYTAAGRIVPKHITKAKMANRLYQMERAGLSTNRVDGVLGDDDLLMTMVKEKVAKGDTSVFKVLQYLNLDQRTPIGKQTIRMFSMIDTAGRYAVVNHRLAEGKSMAEAVKEANGLFGDMDRMVPPVIEMLDKYSFMPFVKWYTVTTPRLMKLTKDNPKKALALGVAIYILGQETDTNLASVNPIEAATDFGFDLAPIDFIEKSMRFGFIDTILERSRATVIPGFWNNALKYPDTIGLEKLRKKRIEKPWSKDSVDFRGFTQQMIEGN